MKSHLFALSAAFSVVFACGAYAGAAAPDGGRAQLPPAALATAPLGKIAKGPDKIICKTTEVTGSQLGAKRTCMTRQRWDDLARTDQDLFEAAQSKAGFAGVRGK